MSEATRAAGLPLALLGAGAVLAFLLDLFLPARRRAGAVLLAALLGIWGSWIALTREPGAVTGGLGALRLDSLAALLGVGTGLSAFLALLVSVKPLDEGAFPAGGYVALVMASAFGMLLLVSTENLFVAFLGLETMSIPLYALTAYARTERGSEGALKYFLLGALATAFLLYGQSLVWGAAGTLDIPLLFGGGTAGRSFSPLPGEAEIPAGNSLLASAGVALFLAGFAFKLGSAPFHAWVPDAYEGAPAPAAGFMAAGVKVAAVGFLLRFVPPLLERFPGRAAGILAALSALSMVVGNLGALRQDRVRRMLGFSSVGHAGYLLLGLLSARGGREAAARASAAVLFYLAAYALQTIGAFGALEALSPRGRPLETFRDLRGLGFRRPLVAGVLALSVVGLAGIPPTAGFLAKFHLFLAAWNAGERALAALAILTSLVAAGYYARVLVALYMEEPEEAGGGEVQAPAGVALVFAGLSTLWLGLWPGRLLDLAREAADKLR